MPRSYNKTSDIDRLRIVEEYVRRPNNNLDFASRLGVCPRTVQNIVATYRYEGRIETLNDRGRPKICEDRYTDFLIEHLE